MGRAWTIKFDLSARAKFRITGADRVRYLNGQISNDVRKAVEDRAIYACVLNVKGRISGDFFIRTDGESFLIDADPALREQLPVRLERYAIADDVQFEDVTQELALLHVLGALEMGQGVETHRFGVPGTDIWLPMTGRDAALEELKLPLCDEDCAETLRIERGIPRWGRELSEEIIPIEAGLETNAIDYAKGCYIGQEVISRIKMSGQTNKRLCGLMVVGEPLPAAGMRLRNTADRKDVGWITSVSAISRLGRPIALGFVKRGFQEFGTLLEAQPSGGDASSPPTRVEIVSLPFIG